MKIGILTFHNIPNIGALLQAYGLCIQLRKFDVECELIDYCCENIVERELTYHPRKSFFDNMLAKFLWKKTLLKINRCQEFMLSQGLYSKKHYNRSNISEANKYYDIFISGSDMIWNLKVTDGDYTYFLDFVDIKKKKCSYGSSVGDIWGKEELSTIEACLSSYSALSARERDTCDIINKMGLHCKHVVDPTMLLTADEWSQMARLPKEKDYVLVYFPTKENKKAAKEYAKLHKKRVVVINMWMPIPGVNNVCPMDPPEWIGYFKNAFAVFTDSFHGILYSMYFHKPFWTGNRGNRISSLLESFGLEHCFLNDDPKFLNTIYYESLDKKMELLREDSINYIKESILKRF